MCDVIISQKNAKDRFFSVNSANELVFSQSSGKEEVLLKDVSSDFDVIAEENGGISVIIASISGSLIWLRFVLGEWKKYVILDSRGGTKKINRIKTIKLNGRIHAFYCIEYEKRMMLVHHISDENEFSRQPYVVDYISLRCSYDICIDESLNIHILYADEDSRLKYIIFFNSKKNYKNEELYCEDEIRSINAAYFQNSLYAAYLSREKEYNVINCLNVKNNEKHTIGFGVDAISEPCIFTDKANLFIEWCEKGYAFECSSDSSFKFSKPYSLGRSDAKMRLRSFNNESIELIDKCAKTLSGGPFPSAKRVLDLINIKQNNNFEPKGYTVQKFAEEILKSDGDITEYLYEKISGLENQMGFLLKTVMNLSENFSKKYEFKDVGNIDGENLKKFNELDSDYPEVANSVDEEYIEIKEESE